MSVAKSVLCTATGKTIVWFGLSLIDVKGHAYKDNVAH